HGAALGQRGMYLRGDRQVGFDVHEERLLERVAKRSETGFRKAARRQRDVAAIMSPGRRAESIWRRCLAMKPPHGAECGFEVARKARRVAEGGGEKARAQVLTERSQRLQIAGKGGRPGDEILGTFDDP